MEQRVWVYQAGQDFWIARGPQFDLAFISPRQRAREIGTAEIDTWELATDTRKQLEHRGVACLTQGDGEVVILRLEAVDLRHAWSLLSKGAEH